MSSNFTEFTQPGQKPVVNSIFDFSADALGQLRLWLEQNPPAVPITSVLGFSQFAATSAVVVTLESSASTSYVDLATTGPTLDGLPDGNYVLLYGGQVLNNTATASSRISPQVNAVAATGADECLYQQPSGSTNTACSIARAVTKKLSNSGSNSVTLKYRVDAGTGQFGARWLIGLKYSNL